MPTLWEMKQETKKIKKTMKEHKKAVKKLKKTLEGFQNLLQLWPPHIPLEFNYCNTDSKEDKK